MEKKICAYLFGITFIALSTVVQGQSGIVQRSPSVENVSEVDIESAKANPAVHTGYDFAKADTPARPKSRVPANIISKSSESPSYWGPMIFLIALPIGLWIIVSKKFSTKTSEEKGVDYFPKTQQFNPYKTDYQKSAETEDDDIDYPKAS